MMANEGTDPVRAVLIERMEKKAKANQDDLLWSFARLLRYTDARILTLVAESMEAMSDRATEDHKRIYNLMATGIFPIKIDGVLMLPNIPKKQQLPRKLTWRERLTGWTQPE